MVAARVRKLAVGVIVVIAAVILLGGYRFYGPRRVPVGQPELVRLDAANFGRLRDDFNAGAEGTRLLALLSPT